MGSGYYVFALFVFALVCVVVVLCKFLFSDKKRRDKRLDEREAELLKLYGRVEDAVEEFYGEVNDAKAELSSLKSELGGAGISPPPQNAEAPAPARASVDVLVSDHVEETPRRDRHELVLQLAREGKTKPQIAKELGITQNEVALIIGLNKK
ncbi:MAG: hypothetical protein LBT12_08320 [Oscillospiraceae bacterium]|jgi:hypothetical protein|nr:hypothetical protein [Oscillospiraceae bacterium]